MVNQKLKNLPDSENVNPENFNQMPPKMITENEIIEAYTEKNLHKITSTLLQAYKDKRYNYLQAIMETVGPAIDFYDTQPAKILNKFMMLYHPDRLQAYHNEIWSLTNDGKLNELEKYAHILLVLNLLDQNNLRPSFEEIDVIFEEEVSYEVDEDFSDAVYYDEEGNYQQSSHGEQTEADLTDDTIDNSPYVFDILSAVKLKEYGLLDIDMSYYDLGNIEGKLSLPFMHLDNLNGIEYCQYVTSLDLSDNQLTDITPLIHLENMEEIYLTNNSITNINVLSDLPRLKAIDLSYNQVIDIGPLHQLEALEYVNLMGNDIPDNQIDVLRNKGVIVLISGK